jgi:hypothetical protein
MKARTIESFKNKAIELTWFIVDAAGLPIDMTGKTGNLVVILQQPGVNTSPAITKALTISDAKAGKVTIILTDTNMAIDVNVYSYTLEFAWGVGDTRVLADGAFVVYGDDTVRIEQIKKKYGLEYDYYALNEAYNWAHKQILNNAFQYRRYPFTAKNTLFKIENYVMDANFDYIINKNDLIVYQYTKVAPYTKTDLLAHVSSVNFDYPTGMTYITMDAEYPTDGYTMVVEYYQGFEKFTDALENIQQVEEMYLLYHLFDVLEPYMLQRGMPDRSINGVDLKFDREGINAYKLKLWKDIMVVIMKIRPIKFTTVQVSKEYQLGYGYRTGDIAYRHSMRHQGDLI